MINLLPYTQKKIIERIRLLRIITVTLFSLTVLTLIGILLFFPTLFTIKSRYALAQKQIEQLEKDGTVTNASEVGKLMSRVGKLTSQFAVALGTSPQEYIAVIRNHAPSGIFFNGFTIDGQTTEIAVEVSAPIENQSPVGVYAPSGEVATTPTVFLHVVGTASNREVLQQFVQRLEKDERVIMVDSPIANYVKNINSEFSITVAFKQ